VYMAAFTLTDWAIIAALKEARTRGVAIRILLDPSQRQADAKLAEMKDVVRLKKRGSPYMHLKAYSIDGTLLRTGSANFSPSGLKQQDNDLIILRHATDHVRQNKPSQKNQLNQMPLRTSAAAAPSGRAQGKIPTQEAASA
jgi:phosphatidylserine/phosphatidylglycerophosphate/cardiolipin synthase-like enzyme